MSKDGPAFGTLDLTTCDREPIHIPGSIQPHGVLLSLDPERFTILQRAGDVECVLGTTKDPLGQPLEAIFGEAEVSAAIRGLLADPVPATRPMFAFETVLRHNTEVLDAIAHVSDDVVVLELEPRIDDVPVNPLALVHEMLLQLAANLAAAPAPPRCRRRTACCHRLRSGDGLPVSAR